MGASSPPFGPPFIHGFWVRDPRPTGPVWPYGQRRLFVDLRVPCWCVVPCGASFRVAPWPVVVSEYFGTSSALLPSRCLASWCSALRRRSGGGMNWTWPYLPRILEAVARVVLRTRRAVA